MACPSLGLTRSITIVLFAALSDCKDFCLLSYKLSGDHSHSSACSQDADNWLLLHKPAEAWLQECVKALVVPI